MKRYVFVFSFCISLLLLSCSKELPSPPLSIETFDYSENLVTFFHNLKNKSKYLSPIKEYTLVNTTDFSITNKYVLPFLYYQLINNSVDVSKINKEELEEFLFFTAYNMAQNEIFYKEAIASGVSIDQEELEKLITSYLGGNIEEFKQHTKDLPIKYDFIVEDLRKNIIIEKYKKEMIISNIEVTEEEAKEYYLVNPTIKKINPSLLIRHITVRFSPHFDKTKAFKKITKAKNELSTGKEFSKVAKKYSEDRTTKNKGGQISNPITRGSLDETIETIAFALPEGAISDIIELPNRYELIKVEQIKDEGIIEYESIKEAIKKLLQYEKQNQAIKEEIERITQKYKLNFWKSESF